MKMRKLLMARETNGERTDVFPFEARIGSGRDAVLDGLRAFAVLAVVVGHAINFRWAEQVDSRLLQRGAGAAAEAGVEIFFLISGYVITRLLILENIRSMSNNLRAFFIRRFFRIFPPLAAYLLAILFLSNTGYINVSDSAIVAGATFVCNTGLVACTWFVGHTWTLSVEEQFYLLWPAVFAVAAARFRLLVLCICIFMLSAFSILYSYKFNSNSLAFCFIAVGCLFAASRSIQLFIVDNIRLFYLVLLLLMLVFAVSFLDGAPQALIKVCILPIIVFGLANVAVARDFLSSPVIQSLGVTSYSTYLWQELFFGSPTEYSSSPPPILFLPIVVALSWTVVEKPSMRLGRWLSKRCLSRH